MSNSAGGVQSDATGNIGGDLNDEPAAGRKWILMNQSGIPLGKIIRSFKAHCTRTIRKVVQTPFLWQRGFYDHIIRSDIDYYFIERYIQLNPLLWYLDSDNADAHGLQREDLESFLREKRILDENTIMFLIEHEMNYLAWRTESV